MNEDTIADLRQFITATVSQAVAGLQSDIDTKFAAIDAKFAAIDTKLTKLDERFDDVDAKLEAIADAHAETLQDHEKRLSHLESQAA